jgi:hypothetical protein
VPRASLRASEESESYISASVEAMVVVAVCGKAKGLWEMTTLLHPLVMPISETATSFQALIYGPWAPVSPYDRPVRLAC